MLFLDSFQHNFPLGTISTDEETCEYFCHKIGLDYDSNSESGHENKCCCGGTRKEEIDQKETIQKEVAPNHQEHVQQPLRGRTQPAGNRSNYRAYYPGLDAPIGFPATY